MKSEEFNKVLRKSITIIDIGIKKGYFKEEDKAKLTKRLIEVWNNGVIKDINGTAIYGYYSSGEQRLHYNAKVFENEQEALIYILHEMKHALDDNENSIGFDSKIDNTGVGINEGATQRFATDIAEEILGEPIPKKEQTSLGITLNTNLDEYQIEDKMNELLCMALGISKADLFKLQNQSDGKGLAKLKEMFDQYADFDLFQNALDAIYAIQEETWIDEHGNSLEKEAEPTKEQTARAKELIRICQEQVMKYIEKANPEKLEEIKENMIMIDGEIMSNKEMLYQDDYLKYQEFITKGLNLEDSQIVYISGLNQCNFDWIPGEEHEGTLKDILERYNEGRTETVYIRKGDIYQKIDVTFNSKGVIKCSEPQIFEDFDSLISEIEEAEVLGNAEEYIKLLQLHGDKEKANIIQRKYEYFMNNSDRIPEIISKIKLEQSEYLEDANMENAEYWDGSEFGEIKFQRITLYRDGTVMEISEEGEMSFPTVSIDILRAIEDAVKTGKISLDEEQKITLLNAKESIEKEAQIGEEEIKEVAEDSVEELDETRKDIENARKEKDKNTGEQGEN